MAPQHALVEIDRLDSLSSDELDELDSNEDAPAPSCCSRCRCLATSICTRQGAGPSSRRVWNYDLLAACLLILLAVGVVVKMAIRDLDHQIGDCDRRFIAKHEWCANASSPTGLIRPG